MKLAKSADQVFWSHDGSCYAVLMDHTIDIYNVESGSIQGSVSKIGRVNCIGFCVVGSESILVAGKKVY